MFADDTKMFKGITNDADRILLQSDIENLVKWSIKWKLPFNSTKCKIMTLGHNQVTSNYTMAYTDSTVTDIAKSVLEKDLGILINNELSFTEHINMVTKKGNGIMAVIIRSFICIDYKCFNLLYKSLVRPHLDYDVTAWFPYKLKDVEAVEKVQK